MGRYPEVRHKPEDLPDSSLNLLTAFGRKAKKLTAMISKHWVIPVVAGSRQLLRFRAT
jgi:hypothetical protein